MTGLRIIVTLAVLVNLILTVAVITQIRDVQQRVASLPPDLATKRDVAALRPLQIRQIVMQNCVACHSARRLGSTISMEPTEIQRVIERMQSHPGANISSDEVDRIGASLLVLRCARCHGEETLNLMVLKTQPERVATIRRMAALPGSGVRPDQVAAISRAFETLVQQGKILYVGSSNFAGWHIAKANDAARSRHFLGLVSEQCIYNLAERTVEMEVLPACEDYGLGVIPWSPLWRGMLGGVLDGEKGGRRGSNMVRDTNTAVKTLASSPMVRVVAKPRIGPVPNWNRKAAAMSEATCVSRIVRKTRSKPAATACLTPFESPSSSLIRSKIKTLESTPMPIVRMNPAMPGSVIVAPR